MTEKYIQNVDKNIKNSLKLITGCASDVSNKFKHHYQITALNKHVMENEENHPVVYNLAPQTFFRDLDRCTANSQYDRYICINPLKCEVVSDKKFKELLEKKYSTEGICTGKRNSRGLKGISRNVKNIFAFKNIVLDIDWHESAPDEIEEYTANFYDYYNDIFAEIPEPNIIHFTGRGMQLIYCLEIASKELSWLYDKTCHALFDALNKQLKKYQFELGFAELDPSVTFNYAALIRMPGTINTCAYLPTYVKILSEKEWNLTDLFNKINGGPYRKTGRVYKTSCLKANDYIKDIPAEVQHQVARYAYALIERISYMEKIAGNVAEGGRELFLFAAYNTYVPIVGRKEAEERTFQLNNKFNKPLSKREIANSIFRTYNSKNMSDWIWFTREKFLQYIGGDLKEAQEMGLFVVHKKASDIKAKEKTAKRKTFRNKYVVETFVEYENVTRTARMCNICRNTVRKILADNKKLVNSLLEAKKLILQRKIMGAARKGKCVSDIVKKFHITKDYAEIVISYFDNLKQSINTFIWTDKTMPECARQQIKDNGLWGTTLNFVIRKISEATGIKNLDILQIALNPDLRLRSMETV